MASPWSSEPPRRSGRRLAAAISPLLALAACLPPRTTPHPVHCPAALPALVDLRTLDPAPAVDVRYATPDNFTGRRLPGYETPRALLRADAAASLRRIQEALRRDGYGLLVWDAYRPVRATLAMVEWAERTGNEWVLEQGYVARQSGHNRGNTIDLTLVDLQTGRPLEMGTAYDHFSEASHTANAEGRVLANRLRLVEAMAAEGWRNYDREWWHFIYPGDAAPLDVPLGCFR